MIDNTSIAKLFKLYSQLLDLNDGNPFKAKSYAAASYNIDKLTTELMSVPREELINLEGLGKGLSGKVEEILATGSFEELNDMLATTPAGVIGIMEINGLGPKKVKVIWKELGIESVGELLYACKENRLANAKGFGLKTQESVLRSIEFASSNSGKYHYARLEQPAHELLKYISADLRFTICSLTGELRRKNEVLQQIEILVAYDGPATDLLGSVSQYNMVTSVALDENNVKGQLLNELPFIIYICSTSSFSTRLFETTGAAAHIAMVTYEPGRSYADEATIYKEAGLDLIEPEMREGRKETEMARSHSLPRLLEVTDLKGILHNHSTYSDGLHSLKDMAMYCRELGYEYLGICDHSRSAFYASGLSIERVYEQHREIDELNKQLAPFWIFKGIESDILNDGSLDYPDEVLKEFDFIVASVHSNLKMPEEKANARLIRAIENPYTTILGHPTGRLLLIREGYPIDHKKIIDACAANGVVIEINANPYRLDLDWRWIEYALEKGVKLSVNPDAHEKQGYHDMYFGVCAARKGGLTAAATFNALDREAIGSYFASRKKLPAVL